ncbi:8839_t:CDS:2, partial [Entrophospora sp. SA101]
SSYENEIWDWELNRKLTAITTDNGNNMDCALKLLKNSLEVDRVPYTDREVEKILLSDDEWLLISDPVNILGQFNTITATGQFRLFDDLQQYEESQGEYEKYFSLPTASRQVDPLVWWTDKKD